MPRKNRSDAPTVIDLFCGCGGFSLGAELAGFHSLAAIDVDPVLQSAYRRNFPGTRTIEGSVAEMDATSWRQFLGRVRPDGIIGGPPCQGFSWIGRRRNDDPRNTLIHDFYRHVDLLRPKFFIMENVEGLIHSRTLPILRDAIRLIENRYRIVGPLTVDAAAFGAATIRRRVVVIGYDPHDVDPIGPEIVRPPRGRESVTVRDAIADLPNPIVVGSRQEDFGWAKYPARAKRYISEYAERLRRKPPNWLGWREAVERHAEGYVSGLAATRHSREVTRRYAATSGGETDHITKSFRLEWSGQSPTLRAGTGADKGAFQAVRPLHPGKSRVITVREAARLQGFPDWFVFHPTKWHSFRMIGNSVSPMVSFGLFNRIARKMQV